MPSRWGDTYEASFDGVHLRVRRRDGKPIRCTWSMLYQIKNDMVGADVVAVEVYPSIEDLVDEVNIRHLFVVPQGYLPRDMNGWTSIETPA